MSHSKADFKLVIPIEKSEGSRVMSGTAAGLGKDSQKQKMSQRAIQSVARQASTGLIPFKDHHAKLDSILSNEIGRVISAKVEEDFSLTVETELEPEGEHPTADYLYKSVQKGKQYGMSIGGTATEFHVEIEDGEPIVVIDDMVLDEISVTTRPAFTNSLGTVVRKAIDAAESESSGDNMEPEIKQTAEPVESPVVTPDPAPEVTVETPAPEAPQADPTVVEKAISADTARENQKLNKVVKLASELNSLLAELGISAVNPVEPQVVEKSQPAAEDTSELEALKAQIEADKKAYAQEMEVLKSMIPSTPIPGVSVRTTEVEEVRKEIASLSASERIRFGLKMKHDGDRI